MRSARRLKFGIFGAIAISGCSGPLARGDIYTLYRSSSVTSDTRLHIATFDADVPGSYNHENCEIARGLFREQPHVIVNYWCEKGRYQP